MDFYAEAPITSFFSRNTTSKKRKKPPEPSSGSRASNKRRGDDSSFNSRRGAKSRDNEQERPNALDNGTILISNTPSVDHLSATRLPKNTRQQQTSERHMPLLPSLNITPQTPKPSQLPLRRNRKISLQTPPPTNEAQQSKELPTPSPCISRKSLDLCIQKVPLPTPSTLGRSASCHIGNSDNERYRVVQEQDSLPPTRPKCSDTSVKGIVPVSIPSSQSQPMAHSYSEDKHRPRLASITALPYNRLPQHAVRVHPSPASRTILNRRDKEDLASHDSQMIISSSQSQFLSPLDEHDHQQPSPIAPNPELDIIPSSQSQEMELLISSDSEGCHQSIRSWKQALPQRTLSDELFSVSILQMGWMDCSLEPEQPNQGTAGIPRVANHGNDSITESKTEAKKKDLYYRDHSLVLMQSQPHGSSQLVNIASLNEDHRDSRNSQQLSQSLSPTSSFASFPDAVKEFQSMFGSDNESYPPDFPMSLR